LLEYTEAFREKNRLNKASNRDLDKLIGKQYRDSNETIPYTEYKKQWLEAQKLKKMKKHYSAFEPMPDEPIEDFKKRLEGITILIPTETIEDFNTRMKKVFGK